MAAVLEQIVAARRRSVAQAKAAADPADLRRRAEGRVPSGFRRALESRSASGEIAVIAELKKASPSRGIIRQDFNVPELARGFERAGAAALSVLTEEQYFQGSLANLEAASQAARLPCLRKDFIVDEFQVLEARACGASAILLIVAALSAAELARLRDAAKAHALDVLCEVHDAEELAIALHLGFDVIGVNNRNLKTLDVDLGTALRLAARIPQGAVKVAESGIHTTEHLQQLREAGYDAFLIGESLMKAPDPGQALRELLAATAQQPAPGR
ncbi:MAG TPA: indole-3-glycerol phosphate synthase TrpC [Terriglobales bacterium]|nr:indole-3-glycerol phosphate synthase TrpC [Terriglobales bacterium]